MVSGLTRIQERVLGFITSSLKEKGVPPSIREIAGRFGFSSTGTVRDHLRALAKKGYIRLIPRRARGIELFPQAKGVPVLGKVSAGRPLEAVENIEGYVDVSGIFPDGDGVFILRVNGESMRDAGILPGDLAVVRKQSTARDGDIVVALIDSEAVIKKFFLVKNGVKLESAHPDYPALIRKDVRVLGRVIGIIRYYRK